MDEITRWWVVLLACAVVSVAAMAGTRAETPESMPSYANARGLRGDASLGAVAFGDQRVGIACGDRGVILRTDDGGQTWQHRESSVDCRLNDVAWVNPQRVVIVGGGFDRITRISRGVVLYSDDAGKHWKRAGDEELPKLRTVTVGDDSSLVASGDWSHTLLTRRLVSHDGGRSWQDGGGPEAAPAVPRPVTSSQLHQWSRTTGIAAAIRDACRIGGSSLCAVGDHGVVLLSRDRGRSWQAVRGEKRRAAILFVSSRPTSVAWSLLGSESLEARHRISLLLHQASASSGSRETRTVELVGQVCVMLGGSGADLIATDDADAGQVAMQWIDIHRPAALVLDESLPASVRDAFFHAATSSGVPRVVEYAFDGGGSTALHHGALLPKAGVLASDLFADAMHYLAPHRPHRPSITLRYLYDVAPATRRGDSVVSGLALEPGQSLAAAPQQVSRRQLQIVQARLSQSQRIANLIRTGTTADQFAESVESILDQTAKEDQFRLAWSILGQTHAAEASTSSIALQTATLDQLASRFPTTSAGRWAALRRDSILHSVEWQRLRSSLPDSMIKPAGAALAEIVPVSPFQVPPSGVRQASATAPLVVPKAERRKLTRQADETAEVDLVWEFHPLVLFAREASRRRSDDGQLQVTGGESANLRRLAEAKDGPWSGLLQTDGSRVTIARRAIAPPKLDGIMNDACWRPTWPQTQPSTALRLAYDEDYVYVAVACHAEHLHPDTLASRSSSIVRDDDLTDVDRMRISIDIDRDLMTEMQIQVSDARRTHDAIDGHPSWQPTWYVDTRRADNQVTIELAILRRDLVDLPITPGESWFVSARTVRAGRWAREQVMPNASDWMRVVFRQ